MDEEPNPNERPTGLGFKPPQLTTMEERILNAWADQGLPGIEGIRVIARSILHLAIKDLGRAPVNCRKPNEEALSAELSRMLYTIPPENSGLDIVYRIRDFISDKVKYWKRV